MLYNQDCLEVLKDIPSESVDLVCTDPPYKIIQGGCTNKKYRLKATDNSLIKNGAVFEHNSIKFSDWMPEIFRVLKDKSHAYIMTNDRNLGDLLNVGEKAGFKLLNILVWKKNTHSPNNYYLKNIEFIALFRKGGAKGINNKGTRQCIEVDNVKNKKHPTQKPVKLMKILVENSSNIGETVLDPFMGCGSTGVACKKLGREFIGIELNKEYFEIAKKRIEDSKETV